MSLHRRLTFLCQLFAFLCFACLCSLRLSAGDKFQPVSPDELRMTSEPQAPGAPAIILFRQVDRDDSNPTSPHEDSYFRIKILTEEGRKHADIEIRDIEPFCAIYFDPRTMTGEDLWLNGKAYLGFFVFPLPD